MDGCPVDRVRTAGSLSPDDTGAFTGWLPGYARLMPPRRWRRPRLYLPLGRCTARRMTLGVAGSGRDARWLRLLTQDAAFATRVELKGQHECLALDSAGQEKVSADDTPELIRRSAFSEGLLELLGLGRCSR